MTTMNRNTSLYVALAEAMEAVRADAEHKCDLLESFATELEEGTDPLAAAFPANLYDEARQINNARRADLGLPPNPWHPSRLCEPYLICDVLLERFGEWVAPAEALAGMRDRGAFIGGRRTVQIGAALKSWKLAECGYVLEKRESPVGFRLVEAATESPRGR